MAIPFGIAVVDFIVHDDNARPHRVYMVEDFHDDYTHMQWLTYKYSPDLNPIKDAWDMLGKVLAKVEPQT